MTAAHLDDGQFARLRALLADAAGLVFDDSRRESLGFSVAERLRATGLPDVPTYLDLVSARGAPERQALLDEVTIQETHFFRNPPQIRALRAHILPELLRAAQTSRRLRIWSAGCSTGEEPYTVAMLLHELLPSTAGWDIRVVATDISARALDAARSARYGSRAVHLATPDELARHLVRIEGGRYQVRPEIRELVEFRHHNLATEPPPFGDGEQVDLVLCRNVTIYFSRDVTSALMRRLHGCLRDGGYLLLGHAETLWRVNDDFRLVALGSGADAAFVYRRLDLPDPSGDRRQVLPDRRTLGAPGATAGDRRKAPRRAWGALTRGRAGAAPASSRGAGPAGPAEPAAGTRPPHPRCGGDPLDPARTALAEGRYADAEALAAEAALADPLRAEAHALRGRALADLGRNADAAVALRKAVYLDPDDGMAHFLLAGVLARLGDGAAAAREYGAAAAVLGRRPASAPAPELAGRSVAELVALCRQLERRLTGELLVAGEAQ